MAESQLAHQPINPGLRVGGGPVRGGSTYILSVVPLTEPHVQVVEVLRFYLFIYLVMTIIESWLSTYITHYSQGCLCMKKNLVFVIDFTFGTCCPVSFPGTLGNLVGTVSFVFKGHLTMSLQGSPLLVALLAAVKPRSCNLRSRAPPLACGRRFAVVQTTGFRGPSSPV